MGAPRMKGRHRHQAEANTGGLKRTLGKWNLVSLGIGCIIGSVDGCRNGFGIGCGVGLRVGCGVG
jgi:hypothetical protein